MPKPFLTYAQQIQKLKDKNLVIPDEPNAAAILHRVMGKNCVKASYSTTSGFHDVNESKWCNAYADDTIPCAVWIFLILLLRNQLFCRF